MTQDQALVILKSGANVFLTGEPGAGKTHTINRYVAWLRTHAIEPALTASTGIAATHVSGMTIHSWSGIGIRTGLTPYELEAIAGNERVFKRISKARVLVIDEVSMLEARTLSMVETVCRAVRRNHLPFGGLQVVLVGDFFQLPPVVRDGRPVEFAHLSDGWAKAQPLVCYLSEQHRQDDRAFLDVLAAIRTNQVRSEHVQLLESRAVPLGGAPDVVNLFPHNLDVDRINQRELALLGGAARTFAMEARGSDHLVEALKRGCLSPENLVLKPGAAVMFTRNNPTAGFVNGTLGTVEDFDDAGQPVVKTRTGLLVAAEPMEWKIEDQGQVLAAVRQVPLRLAWALTVHKSQGLSLDAAVMDLSSAFEYGQGYVALSRVRRLGGLYLLGCNRRALEVHPEVLAQDRSFRTASAEAERQFATIPEPERIMLERNFILACGGRLEAAKREAAAGFGKIAQLRATHPKAYARWSAEEERELVAMFQDQVPIKEIATRIGRRRGGITSRLKKLGLIEE